MAVKNKGTFNWQFFLTMIGGAFFIGTFIFQVIKGCGNPKPSCGFRDGKVSSLVTYIDRNVGIKQDVQLDIDVKDCKVVGIEMPNQYFGSGSFKPVAIENKKATVVIRHMTFRIYVGQEE